jgi:hypothetical protein
MNWRMIFPAQFWTSLEGLRAQQSKENGWAQQLPLMHRRP